MNQDTKKSWLAAKMEVDAVTQLARRLTTIRNECDKKHSAAVASKKEKLARQLKEYKTVDEAHDAYGWGYITEKEFEEIRDWIVTGTEAAEQDTIHRIMSLHLGDIIRRLNDLSSELRYALMTPEEKSAHDQSAKDWKDKIQKIREKRGVI